MKTTSSLTKILTAGCIALAIALVAGSSTTVSAQEKGATKLLQSKPSRSGVVSEATTMSCPQCKDSVVTVVEKPTKATAKAITSTVIRHECPGCKHTFTTAGHGKAKTTMVAQNCSLDSGKDATCCAMK